MIKFRCSGLAHLMNGGRQITEKQLQSITELQNKAKLTEIQAKELNRLVELRDNKELPEAVKKHLLDIWVSYRFKRREEIKSKFLTKGIEREEDGITMLSLINNRFYKKNKIRLENEFITGEPDIFIGESINNAEETFDTKLSWSAHTFFRAKNEGLIDDYEWQGHGYMALTGSKKHTVAYCLTNATIEIITSEKYFTAKKFGYLDIEAGKNNPKFIEAIKQIEINHIFDFEQFIKEYPFADLMHTKDEWKEKNLDIPLYLRVHTFTFPRDEKKIKAIYDTAKIAIDYINKKFGDI